MTVAFALRTVLLVSAAGMGQLASAACYFVYAANHELIYRSNQAPVDLSLPLHMTVPQLSPGARMIFSPGDDNCATAINRMAERAQSAQARNQPEPEHKRREERRF